ncbi:hypothetical protein ACFXG4_14200 [Nocardia sp. NPDC059246]|uniref:hypothetical protein n=1 Tax=unclassified Nocardia TaxID=2637762 RepID=UPI0036A05854
MGDHIHVLVSLTRIGATRQRFDKAFAIHGVEPTLMDHAFASIPGARVLPVAGQPGLFVVSVPMVWLGTRIARDETFSALAVTFGQLAERVRGNGGMLVPTGVGTSWRTAISGGDLHTLAVLSSAEQEVLCNLLRSQIPALVALFGRGITVAGAPLDRIGSRWLAGSASHLATRFLASTAPEHLDRVKVELRRRDGVELLDRMDVYPSHEPDGTLTVSVRCLDAAATLAGIRAQALLLAALAMQARRLVRDGRRVGNTQQRVLEDNRARAVAEGLRARLAVDEGQPARQGPNGATDRSKVANRREASEPPMRDARDVARSLIRSAAVELRNLDADVAELAPVLLPLDLPELGVKRETTESDMLTRWAGDGEGELLGRCLGALADATPGGPLLEWLQHSIPGRTSIVLGSWRSRIADAQPTSTKGRPRQSRDETSGSRPRVDRRTKQGEDRDGRRRGGDPNGGRKDGARGHGAKRRRGDEGTARS